MKNTKQLMVVVSGLGFLFTALSSYAVPFSSSGWYMEAQGGNSSLSDKSYPGSATSSGFGANFNFGYKFMTYMAGEVGFTQYKSTSIKSGNTTAGYDQHRAFDIAGKGILPVAEEDISLFAKIGIARIYSRVKIQDSTTASAIGLGSGTQYVTGAYYGFGVQYNF